MRLVHPDYPPPTKLRSLRRLVARRIAAARKYLVEYRHVSKPGLKERRRLARHALNLARIDPIVRALVYEHVEAIADERDIEDVVALLAAVPFERFDGLGGSVLLNPSLGHPALGIEADADLVVGDCLIDLKVFKEPRIERKMVRQLFGYVMLARYLREQGQAFPEIRSVGIYFARQAYLWTGSLRDVTSGPPFSFVERDFRDQATELKQAAAARLARARTLPWSAPEFDPAVLQARDHPEPLGFDPDG